MKKYEIALIDEEDGIKTYEYSDMFTMQDYLREFIEYADGYLTKIEINIIEQNEFGENLNCWCICTIDMHELRQSEV
jgi:hypothetical protein